jgi:hypothetical protein
MPNVSWLAKNKALTRRIGSKPRTIPVADAPQDQNAPNRAHFFFAAGAKR